MKNIEKINVLIFRDKKIITIQKISKLIYLKYEINY